MDSDPVNITYFKRCEIRHWFYRVEVTVIQGWYDAWSATSPIEWIESQGSRSHQHAPIRPLSYITLSKYKRFV